MSINEIFYSGSARDNESWKKLGLNAVHTESIFVSGNQLIYDKADATLQVSTYNSVGTLVNSNVFSINIHAILVGHIAILTIGALGPYTATSIFAYLGFQLPTDFIPNTLNISTFLLTVNGVTGVGRCDISTTGQVKLYQNLTNTNFAVSDVIAASQQTITYDNDN